MRIVAGVLLALVLLTGCGGGGEETSASEPSVSATPETEPEAVSTREPVPEVDWKNYAGPVKSQIDALGKGKKCQKLQDAFDVADTNDAAQRNRTGDGNADLMGYIDFKMRGADCY